MTHPNRSQVVADAYAKAKEERMYKTPTTLSERQFNRLMLETKETDCVDQCRRFHRTRLTDDALAFVATAQSPAKG